MLLLLLVLAINYWVVSTTRDLIFYNQEQLPSTKVALLLGTSKRVAGGGANKYFDERIEAAAELYRTGVVKHLIVSGDNNTVYYNEPRDMYQALQEMGVPPSAITLDYAGFRTLDSVVRAKLIFGQDSLIIISQDFHCYRALFIARYYGIEAVAYSADAREELPWMLAVREVFARVMAVFDLYVWQSDPKFLGEQEPVIID